MPQRFLITGICWLALSTPRLAAAAEGDLGSRLESFRVDETAILRAASNDDDWNDHRGALNAAYERWLPAASFESFIKSAGEEGLTGLFFETLGYAIDVSTRSGQRKVETVYAGLQAKGWADAQLDGYMHQFLLTFRRFEEAQAFRQARPQQEFPAVPQIVPLSSAPDENARTVLRLIDDGSALLWETVDWQPSARVIVIGHPGCNFSRDAIAAIAADPELEKAMSRRALWLTAPSTSLTDGSVLTWNRENPAYAYRFVESVADWPEINYSGTPSFYFLKDGELVKKVIGWPKGGREDALRAGLRAIGLGSVATPQDPSR